MKYRVTLAVFIVGFLGLASAIVYAQNVPTSTETPSASSVIQQDIFVRGGPGRDYLPVGKLLAGDHIRPLSRNEQGDWVLVIYGKSFGWIRRDLAFWIENIDALPIIDVANLTPSPILPTTPTSTPVLLPTATPTGNWVHLDRDAQSGFVRAGPGRTYLRLGQLLTGDSVEPISKNADGSWIMIQYGEGFGWVSRNLVLWVDNVDLLPVIAPANLTPSATFTATSTASATNTFTPTLTPTTTFTVTSSATPTPVPTSTTTTTPSLTLTTTPLPTLTPTLNPSSTHTLVPTRTPTLAPTATMVPTVVSSATPIPTLTATLTAAIVPTLTSTYTLIFTATHSPSQTPTIHVMVIIPSATFTTTSTSVPSTFTFTPSATFTITSTRVPRTNTYTPVATSTATSEMIISVSPVSSNTVAVSTREVSATPTWTPAATRTTSSGGIDAVVTPGSSSGELPSNTGPGIEVIIAGVVLLLIMAYAVLYWRGISGSERYADGFVIDLCPVCQRGQLLVESRQERLVGIPRSRHSVRCTECRSVLREVSNRQWRYAVDPIENPDLYERFNGRVVDAQTLTELVRNVLQTPIRGGITSALTPPDFVDDDT